MKPKTQEIREYYSNFESKSFEEYCKDLIEEDYVIHQIVVTNSERGNYILILYKY